MATKHCPNCQAAVDSSAPTCPQCGQEVPRGFFGALTDLVFGKRSNTSPPPAVSSEPVASASAPASSSIASGPFSFRVEDVFTITGRGTVVTGIVNGGPIQVGDQVAFTAPDGKRISLRVNGIEAFRKLLNAANPGETVGLLLGSIDRKLLPTGTVLERA